MKKQTDNFHTQINAQGRISIPAKMRHALNLKPGDGVVLHQDEHGIYITSVDYAIEYAQNIVAEYFGDTDLVSELIAERRRAAKEEQGDT